MLMSRQCYHSLSLSFHLLLLCSFFSENDSLQHVSTMRRRRDHSGTWSGRIRCRPSYTPPHVVLQTDGTNNDPYDPQQQDTTATTTTIAPEIAAATTLLQTWDRYFSSATAVAGENSPLQLLHLPTYDTLIDAVQTLNTHAAAQRNTSGGNTTTGRCMLGICAPSAAQGLATLQLWVTTLQLPRGLLHGMDRDGEPIDMQGGVYIKYNSGGVLSFADVRRSQMGFDALWKPGDAMLEEYDGNVRGVYFQVDLGDDDELRQFLLPLDLFGSTSVADEDDEA